MSKSPPVAAHAKSLDGLALEVMSELRSAMAALISSLDPPVTRAVDLQRTLRLDRTLAWQVFRLSQSADLADAAHVPARTSVRRLLEAARRRSVPDSVLEGIVAALDRFEQFATIHGGDRSGLLSVISGNAPEANERYELKIRRAVFRGQAHIWGVSTEMQVRTLIMSEAPGGPAFERRTLIAAEIGLQKMRRSQPLVLTSFMSYDPREDAAAAEEQGPEGESKNFGPKGLNLMTEFCTQPLPKMHPQPSGDNRMEVELELPTTGRAGAATIYMLHDALGAEPMLKPTSSSMMFVCMPTEEIVCDVLAPVGWTNPTTARAMVFARRHHPERADEERRVDLLPQRVSFGYVGSMQGSPAIEGAPHHVEAVDHVLSRLGVHGRMFDVYRCRILYPVLHSLVNMKVDRFPAEARADAAATAIDAPARGRNLRR